MADMSGEVADMSGVVADMSEVVADMSEVVADIFGAVVDIDMIVQQHRTMTWRSIKMLKLICLSYSQCSPIRKL